MKRITLFLIMLVGISGCRQIETITTTTTVQIDTVAVPVEVPGHDFADSFALDALLLDSLLFEDERIRIRIVPDTSGQMPRDVQEFAPAIEIDAQGVGADRHPRGAPPRFRIEAEIKPDTVEVSVAEKTITTETEHVKYVKQMPWWGWMIGGVAAFLLVALGMGFITRRS